QKVLGASRRRVVLADAAKYGKEAFSIFARSGDVDILVSDARFSNEAEMRAMGLEVLRADPL
ncbi:MAG: hypothetical protein JXM71_08010, partial [Spirochaetales bacterium]|nr:hypothetical protein [Spirochaetales bacterium]